MTSDAQTNERILESFIETESAHVAGVMGMHALAVLAHLLPVDEFRAFLHHAHGAAITTVSGHPRKRNGGGTPGQSGAAAQLQAHFERTRAKSADSKAPHGKILAEMEERFRAAKGHGPHLKSTRQNMEHSAKVLSGVTRETGAPAMGHGFRVP